MMLIDISSVFLLLLSTNAAVIQNEITHQHLRQPQHQHQCQNKNKGSDLCNTSTYSFAKKAHNKNTYRQIIKRANFDILLETTTPNNQNTALISEDILQKSLGVAIISEEYLPNNTGCLNYLKATKGLKNHDKARKRPRHSFRNITVTKTITTGAAATVTTTTTTTTTTEIQPEDKVRGYPDLGSQTQSIYEANGEGDNFETKESIDQDTPQQTANIDTTTILTITMTATEFHDNQEPGIFTDSTTEPRDSLFGAVGPLSSKDTSSILPAETFDSIFSTGTEAQVAFQNFIPSGTSEEPDNQDTVNTQDAQEDQDVQITQDSQTSSQLETISSTDQNFEATSTTTAQLEETTAQPTSQISQSLSAADSNYAIFDAVINDATESVYSTFFTEINFSSGQDSSVVYSSLSDIDFPTDLDYSVPTTVPTISKHPGNSSSSSRLDSSTVDLYPTDLDYSIPNYITSSTINPTDISEEVYPTDLNYLVPRTSTTAFEFSKATSSSLGVNTCTLEEYPSNLDYQVLTSSATLSTTSSINTAEEEYPTDLNYSFDRPTSSTKSGSS